MAHIKSVLLSFSLFVVFYIAVAMPNNQLTAGQNPEGTETDKWLNVFDQNHGDILVRLDIQNRILHVYRSDVNGQQHYHGGRFIGFDYYADEDFTKRFIHGSRGFKHYKPFELLTQYHNLYMANKENKKTYDKWVSAQRSSVGKNTFEDLKKKDPLHFFKLYLETHQGLEESSEWQVTLKSFDSNGSSKQRFTVIDKANKSMMNYQIDHTEGIVFLGGRKDYEGDLFERVRQRAPYIYGVAPITAHDLVGVLPKEDKK